ncbi:hypothetical protein AMATHDRAFT_78017 [Amanita thiersii Skay4041]|uniref:Thioredoxin domain-containing protein n=1 Tax=Amanita thiersii Skay4041 TaxID=703135 RepID=A0A2A9N7J7_9AGAR|nr:hypothetical protein AMATHDRAFT_78017 [Amanita thiersii Skay4041]
MPSLVSAAIFPSDTKVKMLDPKGFKKVMKANQTSVVAFVAPWCGHCQRMAPEYSKAAKSLLPLIPVYAIDCDNEKNKRLCAEQHVQGFPTVKLYPRGNQVPPMTYESGDRTASAFFNWASLRVPSTIDKLAKVEDITSWADKHADKHRALLLTKEKKVPLLWKVLGNNYKGELQFGVHRDQSGEASKALGLGKDVGKGSKVVIYVAGSTTPTPYDGKTKLETISKFFDSILDGLADILASQTTESVDEKVASPEDHTQKVFESEGGSESEDHDRPKDEL